MEKNNSNKLSWVLRILQKLSDKILEAAISPKKTHSHRAQGPGVLEVERGGQSRQAQGLCTLKCAQAQWED